MLNSIKIVTFSTCAFLLGISVTLGQIQTLQVAHPYSEDNPFHIAATVFASNVESRSNQRINVDVYPNDELGHFTTTISQLRAGKPILIPSTRSYFGDFAPELRVLEGHYLLRDPSEINKITESELFADIRGRLRTEAGFEMLSLNWVSNIRQMISDKTISSPEDIADMRFQIPPNTMWIEMFTTLDAVPVQMPWEDVYSALANGKIDGAEAPLEQIYESKLFETKKIVSMTGHFVHLTGLVMNADVFAQLPPDIQVIINDEAEKAGKFMTELVLKEQAEWIEKLEAEGVSFNRNVDLAPFQAATTEVYSKIPFFTFEMYESIREILNN